MKRKFTLIAFLALAFFVAPAQQIPNGGFETWTNSFTPTSWTSVEDLVQSPVSVLTFKDSLDFVEGHASLEMHSDSVAAAPSRGVVSDVISLGTGTRNGGVSFHGVPFAFRPDSFFFSYKYTSPGTDTAQAIISLTRGGVTQVLGAQFLLTESSAWSPTAIPLAQFYDTAGLLPDTLLIQFITSHLVPVKGSNLHLDGLRFGYIQSAPALTATITPMSSPIFCQGDSVMLMANTGTNYSYQWNKGGSAITGATGANYWAKDSGSYTVMIDSAGVMATSNVIVVKDSNCTTGIYNIAGAEFIVYPNPATGLLNIGSSINLDGSFLCVYDLTGRVVVNRFLEGRNNLISVAGLAGGAYLVRIFGRQSEVLLQSKLSVIK